MAYASAPASLTCLNSSPDFFGDKTAVWNPKLNKSFPPQLALGHDVCAGIETLRQYILYNLDY